MIKWPTFSDFRARLVNDFQCTYRELPGKLSVNDSAPQTICYLQREVNGEVRRYAVALTDDERVAPSVIRSICTHLGIDTEEFGLSLG